MWSLLELDSWHGVESAVPSGSPGPGSRASLSPSVRWPGQGCPPWGLVRIEGAREDLTAVPEPQ